MNPAESVGLAAVGAAFVFNAIRGYRRARRTARWTAEHETWKARQVARSSERELAYLEHTNPFLAADLRRLVESGLTPRQALDRLIKELPGLVIGTGRDDIPVFLPLSARTRHLSGYGATGTGKTTLIDHLITDDFSARRNVLAFGAEQDWFLRHIFPRLPLDQADRTDYFAPGNPACPLTYNLLQLEQGETKAEAAGRLFHAFRDTLREASIGRRSDPLARNLLFAAVCAPNLNLLHLGRILTDPEFRAWVLTYVEDPECRSFWIDTFPRFPKNSAVLPLLARLDYFVGSPLVRRALCAPKSNFSIRERLKGGHLFVDVSGLDPDVQRTVFQVIFLRAQAEFMARETLPESERPLTMVYADEYHIFGNSTSAYAWRQAASRGRRMNAALALFSQHPDQIDPEVRHETLANTATLVCFATGARAASTLHSEFVVPSPKDGRLVPVSSEALIGQRIGRVHLRAGTGAWAQNVRLNPPLPQPDPALGLLIRERAWSRFRNLTGEDDDPRAANSAPAPRPPGVTPTGERSAPAAPRSAPLSPTDDQRYLDAVRGNPGRNSSEYAKLARMSGASALACRKRLVAAGLIREHRVATGARGRSAIVLEPVAVGSEADR